MIKRAADIRVEKIVNMRGGNKEVYVTHVLEKEEFKTKGRLFAKIKLEPGASIGLHTHTGDFETFYILKGEGTLQDNGSSTVLRAGDMSFCDNGQSHAIENTGDVDLEIMALILFDDSK